MNCPIPSPLDVRHFLEGFCLETQDLLVFSAIYSSGSLELQISTSVSNIRKEMPISGSGIPTGAKIASVDYSLNKVTISALTTGSGSPEDVTVTRNTFLTDEWIINRRDRFVIPWIEKRTGLNITGEKSITEYVSGNGLTSMILSKKPIIELTELSYTRLPDGFTGNLQESVVVDKEQGMLMSRWSVVNAASTTVFQRGIKNIKVVYSYGFEDICTSAPNVPEAILNWLAALSLQNLGSRSGGGNINQPGYGQSFGDRGKYTEAIQMAETNTMAILRDYFNYVGAP